MSEPVCKLCQQVTKEVSISHGGVLYEDDLWIVVHTGDPVGVIGWLQLIGKRHFQGPADMTDIEAANVGPMLRHCEAIIKQISGAPNVFTAALGASYPHFHCHMVPIIPGSIKEVNGGPWDAFVQPKIPDEDEYKCGEIAGKFKEAISKLPPPK
mmetsp:Transcript_15129/g.20879  ORF Transcript_15129/g.20879 Transcript_15129/m.20879 type:complete len:154 (-) Transcript_15129:155-616(-)|eukprot:CAMPEP_0196591950 /NCGR_PEP_ID=MMETSP1081-20130531/71396_1 /TAXON_ID=36882 /ORGANISM="Pyramimonas amylifera, Strain CCMP720" /LENGTH=153 /DNA_ID=CAMNT_0041915493 /DNA_START=170 /DNA_END=631 /DNA_ORIENTATION=+